MGERVCGDSMRIRFRTDGPSIAELKGLGKPRPDYYDQALWDATPPAEPGDTWRMRWHGGYDKAGNRLEGPVAGYAICCPQCREVHHWTTADNCATKGQNPEYPHSCLHSLSGSLGSCWIWTGSAEDGTLTAHPSLFASGACGWHGWLQNGDLHL